MDRELPLNPDQDTDERSTAENEPVSPSVHRAPGRDLGEVEAQTVLLERSGAESISAETVRMERSGARTIDAHSVEMDRSGTVALGSDHAVLPRSSAVQVVGERVDLSESRALIVSARQATIERSSIVVFAGTADGDVHTLFTARTAALAGGAFALVLVLLATLVRSRDTSSDSSFLHSKDM